jgi:hypothetical protein
MMLGGLLGLPTATNNHNQELIFVPRLPDHVYDEARYEKEFAF